jgi:RHS repeat-associated protein
MVTILTEKSAVPINVVPLIIKKMAEYTGYYTQQYRFDDTGLGNMTLKSSSTVVNPPRLLGDPLDYQLSYEYEPGYAHRASRIGTQYYRYDLNGSVVAVQDHPFEPEAAHSNPTVHDLGSNTYYTEGGWGLNEPKTGTTTGTAGAATSRKEYRWDDRNRLRYSNNGRYSVRYTYGEDGERTGKWVNSNVGGESESLYFGKLWTWHYDGMVGDYTGMNSKHIFVGETRIATKVVYADGSFIQTAEQERQFYYHSDHLGSAQLITDYKGEEYERLEYTPYGELWVEKASAVSALDVPYRFTGKERDKETGLYYYGARYLDPRDSRWLSVDPAMGEYVPVAPVNDEARKRNQNLPGMGGVFNTINLHVYHYAGNNPVKYVDPDGRKDDIPYQEVNETFKKWLETCDPKYYVVARDIKVYLEDSATMGRRPSEAEITREAENALLGQMIYAMVGAFAIGLTQLPVTGSSTGSFGTNKSTIRTLDNPKSLRGATKSEVEKLIPKDWIASPAKKGNGIRFINPNKNGESIIIENGWPGSNNVHGGPYVRISRNGEIIREPLAGNLILKK